MRRPYAGAVHVSEAFEELGLDATASNDDIRRAYLRLLKTRKPEHDPEGFKRLREAYELSKSVASSGLMEPESSAAPPLESQQVAPTSPATSATHEHDVPTLEAIDTLLFARRYREASEAMIRLLESTETRPDAEAPDAETVLELGIVLVEGMFFRNAIELQRAFDRWLGFVGARWRLGATTTARWVLFVEYVAIGKELSDPVRRAIGQLLRRPDDSPFLPEMRGSDWREVRNDLRHLESRAPQLHALIEPHLARVAPARHRGWRVAPSDTRIPFNRLGLSLIVGVLMFVLRVVAASSSCSRATPSQNAFNASSYPAPRPPLDPEVNPPSVPPMKERVATEPRSHDE